MSIFIGIILLLIGILLGIILEKFISNIKNKKIVEKSNRKIGQIRVTCIGIGPNNKNIEYVFDVTLEEIGTAGKLSKVNILGISNCANETQYNQVKTMVGQYVRSSEIEWQEPESEKFHADAGEHVQ